MALEIRPAEARDIPATAAIYGEAVRTMMRHVSEPPRPPSELNRAITPSTEAMPP